MAGAQDLFLGIDSSTTSCKAIAWDAAGNSAAEGRAPHGLSQPRPGWHEQNAEDWWTALIIAVRSITTQIDARRIRGVCLSIQRETFVLVDAARQPVAPALVWMDERAQDAAAELASAYGKERAHQECGKPLTANLTVAKLFWLWQNVPYIHNNAAYALDVHAFLAHRLTGRLVTSYACADPTGLLHMPEKRWNSELLEAAGWSNAKLPVLVETGALAGLVSEEAARATGLTAGTPLFAGLGDGQAAGLGSAVVRTGDAYLNLGTAVVSGTYSAQYRVDRGFRTHFGASDPAQPAYLLETVLLGGTYTINWLLEQFSPAGGLPALENAAALLPAGAEGLVLVPYWNSAMNPYWDSSASGITVGWRGTHGAAHLYRAILEGIAMEQRLATTGVEASLQLPIRQFLSVGGGSKSQLWKQIIADVTGKPVLSARSSEASALGAGILAAVSAGRYESIPNAAQAMVHIDPNPVLPGPQQEFYERLYTNVYAKLYPLLRETLSRLASLTKP